MLKAYVVTEGIDYEASVLVFAETVNQAKSIAKRREELDGFEYVDLRASRAKYADGYDNATEKELMVLNIQNGWWYEIGGTHIDADNVDEILEKGIL